jgi:hypothetical protein
MKYDIRRIEHIEYDKTHGIRIQELQEVQNPDSAMGRNYTYHKYEVVFEAQNRKFYADWLGFISNGIILQSYYHDNFSFIDWQGVIQSIKSDNWKRKMMGYNIKQLPGPESAAYTCFSEKEIFHPITGESVEVDHIKYGNAHCFVATKRLDPSWDQWRSNVNIKDSPNIENSYFDTIVIEKALHRILYIKSGDYFASEETVTNETHWNGTQNSPLLLNI